MLVVYDLETLRNYFLYVDVDLGNNFHVFECSIFKNQIEDLISYLKDLKGQVGFNNVGFDAQVQQFIIKSHNRWKDYTGDQIAALVHDFSQTVIDIPQGKWPPFAERDFSIKQADLFKIFHYNNKARTCSLKWLQYSMDWSNIEDMPISHNTLVEDRKTADSVIEYCKNDCLSTKAFYDIARGVTEHKLYKDLDKFQLRKDIRVEFGFNCTNYDDVKIGDQINKVNYLRSNPDKSYSDLKNLKSRNEPFTFGDCFPSYVEFQTHELKVLIDRVRNVQVDLNSKDQNFPFTFSGIKYTLAKGGLHSEDYSRIIIPKKDEILRDADVGSMYPNAIRKRRIYPEHLGPTWLDGYTNVIEKRLAAKKLYKETKDKKYQSVQEAFKLALNGGSFGKLGEPTNWQYSPKCGFQVTIGCQIDLLMLIEMFEINGIKVLSANTDGVVCLFKKNMEEMYNKICKNWENVVGNNDLGQLEYSDYQLLAQRSVNDYIAIKLNGEAKEKGSSFTIHHELHKNKSYRIVALALNAFYTKGVNPRAFITDHTNIFDFCAGIRTRGTWYMEARGLVHGEYKTEKLQKTNRYYISNTGYKLVKCNTDGREIREDAGKWMATIYNKHIDKPISDYNINYDFYVQKTYDIISEIQPEIINEDYTQLSLF